MPHSRKNPAAHTSGLLVAAALCMGLSSGLAAAQAASDAAAEPLPPMQAVDAAAEAAPSQEVEAWQAPPAPRVGEATHHLFALQREGQIASSVPRPIAGDVAQRSRERYLKSFEREIPERFQSSVAAGKTAGGR